MRGDLLTIRLGVFAELAESSKSTFGRTALMKLCYFLQEAKSVPLNYEFSLYSYGPFDSDVLADLQTAVELQILESTVEHYPGGFKYLICKGHNATRAKEYSEPFLAKHRNAIRWAATTLAPRSASELELMSTIAFVLREKGKIPDTDLATLVRAIKPHFSTSDIKRQTEWLRSNKLLEESTSS